MKITKSGEIYKFICEGCGCEYVAGVNEVRNCGFYVDTQCPECGTVNKYKEVETEKVGEENEGMDSQGYSE